VDVDVEVKVEVTLVVEVIVEYMEVEVTVKAFKTFTCALISPRLRIFIFVEVVAFITIAPEKTEPILPRYWFPLLE
jgi:hypothetical protein